MDKQIQRIHMIGVCGVAMGTVAAMLKEKGYTVQGSDQSVYPPMSTMLREWGITLLQGFQEQHLKNVDLVIVGNAISRGNVEVEYVLNEKIPYISMVDAIRMFFLTDKEVIAVCGTHGKTTTTALMSHILDVAGLKPSFLIGGVALNYATNFKLGEGKYFVIEGDEYDSAFFEKTPKFIHYRPYHAIFTSLEFDHADIYHDLGEIEVWFKRLANLIPSRGTLVYNAEYNNLSRVITTAMADTVSYGKGNTDFRYFFQKYDEDRSLISLTTDSRETHYYATQLMGDFNYANICAAVAMALKLGVTPALVEQAVASFKGVKRRQQLLYSDSNLKIYEDFAHHPTAIAAIIHALRDRYEGAVLWALYEPRSATSRRNVLQQELIEALALADMIKIKNPYKLDTIPGDEQLHVDTVCKQLQDKTRNAGTYTDVRVLVDELFATMDRDQKNVIVIMSNGGFDNIYEYIVQKAEE